MCKYLVVSFKTHDNDDVVLNDDDGDDDDFEPKTVMISEDRHVLAALQLECEELSFSSLEMW